RVLEYLGAGPAQIVLVAPGDRDEPAQADLAVAGGQLGLAAERGLVALALASGLQLAEAVAKLAVCSVPSDGGLDLAGGALRRERLEGHGHGADRAGASEERIHEQRRDLNPGPTADPIGCVDGAVRLVVVPGLTRGEWPRARLGQAVSIRVGRLERGQLGAGERIKGGA